MLTKIVIEDPSGTILHEVEAAIVETLDVDDPDDPLWRPAVIWNDRVFVAVNIPDCDAPENYQKVFAEVPVVAVVNGDESALAERINRLANGRSN